jgi:hypothetical protein
VIPLQAYRVAPRKPWVRVAGDAVTFRLPGWFGGRTFAVPLADVGVVDLDLVQDAPAADVVYAEPVVVPYVYTTGPMTAPNLRLVFRRPVALPPFRFVVRQMGAEPAPKRAARGDRPAGRYVDGLLLRAADPRAAVAQLAAAGAERVTDVDGWLAAHRPLVTDPERVAGLAAVQRRFARAGRAGTALASAGLAGAVAGGVTHHDGVVGVAGAVLVAGLATHQAAARLAERRWFRRPDAGPPRPPGAAPAP